MAKVCKRRCRYAGYLSYESTKPDAGESPTRFLVIGSEFDGAFAQYCSVPAGQLHDVSKSPLTSIEIAAIPCAHGKAFNLPSRTSVKDENDHVLVTGASGGMGLAVVELAKLLGANVTAMASPDMSDAVYDAGADSAFVIVT